MGLINRSVVAVVYDGLCGFEFGVATELFGLARPELDVDWYDFDVVTPDPGPLRALGGLTFDACRDLTRIEQAGTVVLPGWRDPGEEPPAALVDAIRVAHANGARILSICSGVFVIAATGLLDRQPATTHWRYTDRLAAMYPLIDVRPDVLYVDNGTILTSAGSAAGIDLGLHLIRRDFGASVATEVARRLVLPPHRDGGQAQFISAPVPTLTDTSLNDVIEWALGNLASPLTVSDLARHANVAPRTFARRFRAEIGATPHRWLTRQRVALVQQLLETTDASIEEIAQRAGFGSAATLRHHFHRELRTTPVGYRSSFRHPTPAQAPAPNSGT